MGKIDAITKTLLHEETLIGTALSHFHGVGEAQKLTKIAVKNNPVVSFGKKLDGHITYGHEITPDTLEHARIRISHNDAEPQYRYFKRIAAQDGTKINAQAGEHGLSASAWVETDAHGVVQKLENGKCNLRVCYPGYTGGGLHSAQTHSMDATLHGEFYQAREVGPFLDKAMDAAKTMEIPVGSVINNSWSMGSANALASNLYFKHRGIPTKAILGDPWRASNAVQNIAQRGNILRPLFNGSHAETLRYTQPQLRKMLAEDVISVYPATRDQAGKWLRQSMTAPGPTVKLQIPGIGIKVPRLGGNIGTYGETVGQVFHLDTGNMEVLEHLPGLGNTHHRTNILNHLAAYSDDALHEVTQVAAKGAGHSRVV